MRVSTEPRRPGSPGALGLDPALDRAGVNLAGVLAPPDFDEAVAAPWATRKLLPTARSVVVLGCGGPDFFRAFRRSPERARVGHALDAFLARLVGEARAFEGRAGYTAAAGFYFERRDGVFADLVSAGRRAGLGVPSRLAILLHPDFGPWLSLRALLFTTRALEPTEPDPGFDPCEGCPAPCAAACPGGALDGRALSLPRCLETSARVADCTVGCAARRACVVGPTHRYDADAEAWHRRAALAHGAG